MTQPQLDISNPDLNEILRPGVARNVICDRRGIIASCGWLEHAHDEDNGALANLGGADITTLAHISNAERIPTFRARFARYQRESTVQKFS